MDVKRQVLMSHSKCLSDTFRKAHLNDLKNIYVKCVSKQSKLYKKMKKVGVSNDKLISPRFYVKTLR